MIRRVFVSAVLLALLSVASPAFSDEWTAYSNPAGKFSASFPDQPQAFLDSPNATGGIVQVVKTPLLFVVFYANVPSSRADIRSQLNRKRDEITAIYKASPVSQKTSLTKVGDRELLMLEFVADAPDPPTNYTWRILYKDQRMYAFGIGVLKGYDGAHDTQRFFESFALTND
jgi:hypothetical protein